jgi:hypothetical protein
MGKTGAGWGVEGVHQRDGLCYNPEDVPTWPVEPRVRPPKQPENADVLVFFARAITSHAASGTTRAFTVRRFFGFVTTPVTFWQV